MFNKAGPTGDMPKRQISLFEIKRIVKLTILGAVWRLTHKVPENLDDPKVTFLIPLIAKKRAQNWSVVEFLLAETLRSIRHQTNPNWHVIICGQDRPELPEDPRIVFEPFTRDIADSKRTDKWLKNKVLCKAWRKHFKSDGYLFMLDADDLVHPELVERIIASETKGVLMLARGYMANAHSGEVCDLTPIDPATRKPKTKFFATCGSCAAIRVSPASGPFPESIVHTYRRHYAPQKHFPKFGFRIDELNAPSAVYMVNHGDNMDWQQRYKARNSFIRSNALNFDERDQVLADFNLETYFDRFQSVAKDTP
ncbi:MAG: glycosyltransferase family 2 protein [Pseudomonadota bacterium]